MATGFSFTIRRGVGELACAMIRVAERARNSEVGPGLGYGVRKVATHQRKVALTFDDGPSASTVEVAAVLERNAFRGTFFVCGANVTRFPTIVRTLHEGGHAIGNHTYSHRQLYFCSASQIRH